MKRIPKKVKKPEGEPGNFVVLGNFWGNKFLKSREAKGKEIGGIILLVTGYCWFVNLGAMVGYSFVKIEIIS